MKIKKKTIPSTKERLLDAGLEMMHSFGYRATGIQGVLSSADVPKGSFYNYFKSKEDFGLEVLDRYIELQGPIGMKHMADLKRPPLKRLKGFFDEFIALYKINPSCGCLLGNFAQELSDGDHVFRKKLAEFCISGWEGSLIQMKLQKSVEPLESFVDILFSSVLKK